MSRPAAAHTGLPTPGASTSSRIPTWRGARGSRRTSRRHGSFPGCSPRPPGSAAGSCRSRTRGRPSRCAPPNDCLSGPGVSCTGFSPTTRTPKSKTKTSRTHRKHRQARQMDDGIRVSDADREHVTERLREHYAEGRLSSEELEERITAALSAKTYGDLRRLMADLPEPALVPPGHPDPPPWVGRRGGLAWR